MIARAGLNVCNALLNVGREHLDAERLHLDAERLHLDAALASTAGRLDAEHLNAEHLNAEHLNAERLDAEPAELAELRRDHRLDGARACERLDVGPRCAEHAPSASTPIGRPKLRRHLPVDQSSGVSS